MSSDGRQDNGPRESLFRNPFVWAFFGGIIVLTLIRPLLKFEPDPPPVLGQVPAFSLRDQTGAAFGSENLEGRIYVANLFFTRCTSICLPLMHAVTTLEERYDREGIDDVRLVSITVDPETDTPERLAEYAARLGIDADRWRLLTGDPDDIRDVVVDGFKVTVGDREEGEAGFFDIAHSGKLVLVDRHGRIRGYYDYDALGLDEVFHRSRHLLKGP